MTRPAPIQPGTGRAVLLVDDDEALLSAMVRLLRPDGLRVLTAPNADRALDVLEAEGAGVGVVVTDYVMPGMNGADLLRAIRLRWPDATRILATGNADLSGAARAVNEGQVSRLITKPADPNLFREVVASALADSELLLENRRLRQLADEQSSRLGQWNQRLEEVVSQRTADLEKANLCLERGLLDTVRLLLSILERRLPERANRCREVARLAGRLGMRAELAPDMLRRVQVAALIFDIGLIGLPDPIIRQHAGRMPDAARLQFEQHAAIGQMMLSKVEPLAETATWIRHHHERWDGRGYPDRLAGPAIPLPSRIIALADGYLEAVQQEGGTAPRWRSAQRAAGAFDPDLVEALAADVGEVGIQSHVIEFELPVSRLWAGLRLARPITSANKSILISAGTILTTELIARIQALAGSGAVALDGVSVIGSATNSTARPQVPGGRPG